MGFTRSRSNNVVASFVRRAEACGCFAIVLTLDTTMLGWRPRDLDLAFLPFLQGKGIAQYTSDPVFLREVREGCAADSGREGAGMVGTTRLTDGSPGTVRPANKTTPPLNFHTLATALEQKVRFPGGLTGNLTSPLPRAAVVNGKIPVLFDSGVRGGADVFKALALGATAVCLGRPDVYGLALAGEPGVREVMVNVLAEFDLTLGLAGCTSVREITREALA